jgi:flagellar hook-associated protein 1
MQSGDELAILGAAYQIGRSALAAYQTAVAITGQNIANVGNSDYTRLSGRLAALYSGTDGSGLVPGTGVDLSGLERNVDEAVESRLRMALGAKSGAGVTYQTLSRVEAIYNELSDGDLSSQLSSFFSSLSNLQTDPTESTARNLVLANADAIIKTLQRQRTGILDQVDDLNKSASEMTRQANALAGEVADLNEKIATVEGRVPGGAAALRDRRDTVLRQLGELVDIQTREQPGGAINVYVGSEPLVTAAGSRGLQADTVLENGLERVRVRFADNHGTVVLGDGKLAAAVNTRDGALVSELGKIDQLAKGLIYEVNRAQTSGRGLVGYTGLVGDNAVANTQTALNDSATGLPFPVQNGTFYVHLRDKATGATVTQMIEVDLDGLNHDDTSLASLAANLNGVPNLTASVTSDGRLQLSAKAGYDFSFSEDTSGALAALGVGTLFSGTNAGSMALNSAVQNDPRLIATSLSGAAGDGTNAGRLAAVADQVSTLLGGASILDFQSTMVTSLAVRVSAAETTQTATDAVYSSLVAQREATSGVSLDEEAINLTKYERAFQGASRFVSVLDSLSDEILALVS